MSNIILLFEYKTSKQHKESGEIIVKYEEKNMTNVWN